MMTTELKPHIHRMHKHFVSHFSMLNTFGVLSIDFIAHFHSFTERKKGEKKMLQHSAAFSPHTVNTHTIDYGK